MICEWQAWSVSGRRGLRVAGVVCELQASSVSGKREEICASRFKNCLAFAPASSHWINFYPVGRHLILFCQWVIYLFGGQSYPSFEQLASDT